MSYGIDNSHRIEQTRKEHLWYLHKDYVHDMCVKCGATVVFVEATPEERMASYEATGECDAGISGPYSYHVAVPPGIATVDMPFYKDTFGSQSEEYKRGKRLAERKGK